MDSEEHNLRPGETEFGQLLAEAKEGDAEAQFNLGKMYHQGQGVLNDDKEAVKWWRKAADQGHREAKFYLATTAWEILLHRKKLEQKQKSLKLEERAEKLELERREKRELEQEQKSQELEERRRKRELEQKQKGLKLEERAEKLELERREKRELEQKQKRQERVERSKQERRNEMKMRARPVTIGVARAVLLLLCAVFVLWSVIAIALFAIRDLSICINKQIRLWLPWARNKTAKSAIYLGTDKSQKHHYVGQTINNPKERWEQHSGRSTGPFKDGASDADWKILKEASNDPDYWESYYIGFYNSYEDGHNGNRGRNLRAYELGWTDRISKNPPRTLRD